MQFTHEDGSTSGNSTEPEVAAKSAKKAGNSKKPAESVSLSIEMVEERKNGLLSDLDGTQKKLAEIDKAKSDTIALAHALNGAIQQCDDFLEKLGAGNNAGSSIPQN